VGRFSRGKSSLINAIPERDNLPTGIIPLTSVIMSVSYGSVERVMLRFTRSFMDQEVPISELRSYVTQEQNPGNPRQSRKQRSNYRLSSCGAASIS
jgi:hypothetical protein